MEHTKKLKSARMKDAIKKLPNTTGRILNPLKCYHHLKK